MATARGISLLPKYARPHRAPADPKPPKGSRKCRVGGRGAAPWLVGLGIQFLLWVQEILLASAPRGAFTFGHPPCPALRVTLADWVHPCRKDRLQRTCSKMLLEERDVAEINPHHSHVLLPPQPPPCWLWGCQSSPGKASCCVLASQGCVKISWLFPYSAWRLQGIGGF